MHTYTMKVYSKRLQDIAEENLYFFLIYLVLTTNIIYKMANIFETSNVKEGILVDRLTDMFALLKHHPNSPRYFLTTVFYG